MTDHPTDAGAAADRATRDGGSRGDQPPPAVRILEELDHPWPEEIPPDLSEFFEHVMHADSEVWRPRD